MFLDIVRCEVFHHVHGRHGIGAPIFSIDVADFFLAILSRNTTASIYMI